MQQLCSKEFCPINDVTCVLIQSVMILFSNVIPQNPTDHSCLRLLDQTNVNMCRLWPESLSMTVVFSFIQGVNQINAAF